MTDETTNTEQSRVAADCPNERIVMRKKAIKIVEDCHYCPFRSPGFLSEPDECGKKGGAYEYFIPRSGIPDWCPLEDA